MPEALISIEKAGGFVFNTTSYYDKASRGARGLHGVGAEMSFRRGILSCRKHADALKN